MAGVIKERVSFRNTTIGVVRAPTAAVEAWRGAYESANQLTNQAYKMAAVEARKKGIEVAEQLEREQIRTINPETGKPEAMSLLPTGFGSIAQDAYESVIDKRFQESINQEIKSKAATLALKYQGSDKGVEEFKTTFGDYIDNMHGVAIGKYKGYIESVGSEYLASTGLNLEEKRVARQLDADRTDVLKILQSQNSDILDSAFAGAKPNEINEMFESQIGLIEDARDSNLLTGEAYETELKSLRHTRQKSIFLSKIPNFNDLGIVTMRQIKSAINSNGVTISKIKGVDDNQTAELQAAVTQVLKSGSANQNSKFVVGTDTKELTTWLDSYISDKNAIQTEELQQESIAKTENYSTIHVPKMNKFTENFMSTNVPSLQNSNNPVETFIANQEVLAGEKARRTGLAEDRAIKEADVAELNTYRQLNSMELLTKVFGKDMSAEKWANVKQALISKKEFPKWMNDTQKAAVQAIIDTQGYKPDTDMGAFTTYFNQNGSTESVLKTARDAQNEKNRISAIPSNNLEANNWASNYESSDSLVGGFDVSAVADARKQLDERQVVVNKKYSDREIDESKTRLQGSRRIKTSQFLNQILPDITNMEQTDLIAVETYLNEGKIVKGKEEFITRIKPSLDSLIKNKMYIRGVDGDAFGSWFNSKGVDASKFSAEAEKIQAEEDAAAASQTSMDVLTGAAPEINNGDIRAKGASTNNDGSNTFFADTLQNGFDYVDNIDPNNKKITSTVRATALAGVIDSTFGGFIDGLQNGSSVMKNAEGKVVELNSRSLRGIHMAIKTNGGNMSGVPESHREQLSIMIEMANAKSPNALQGFANDVKTIIGTLRTEENQDQELARGQNAGEVVEGGQFGSTSYGSTVADQKTYINKKAMTATDNDIGYFLKEENLPSENMPKGTREVYRQIRNLHAIPEVFSNTMDKLANGQLSAQQANVAIQHYANNRNAVSGLTGYSVNHLSIAEGGTAIDSKVIAKLDTVLSIMDVENIDAASAITRVNEVDDTAKDLNRTVFQRNMKEALDKSENETYSVKDYLIDNFEGNLNVVTQLLPYAETMIENGMTFQTLDKKLDDFYNTQFLPTEGFVVDFSSGYGNRSRASLRATVGEANVDGFVDSVDDLLATGTVFTASGESGSFLLSKDVEYNQRAESTFFQDMGEGAAFFINPQSSMLMRESRKAEAIAKERELATSDDGTQRKAVLVPIRYSNNQVMYRVMGIVKNKLVPLFRMTEDADGNKISSPLMVRPQRDLRNGLTPARPEDYLTQDEIDLNNRRRGNL
jgi:hypothetical protein